MLNHNYIGTEHLLLGLIHEGDGVAARALESLDVSLGTVRRQVEEVIGQGTGPLAAHIPFTPRAKKVLELSLREAQKLGHSYIGTEHILLGLIREGEGVAAQVLEKMGANLDTVRQKVVELLSGYTGTPEAVVDPAVEGPEGRGPWPRCPRCGADLNEETSFRVVAASEHLGDSTRYVVMCFCRRCGTALGAWPEP